MSDGYGMYYVGLHCVEGGRNAFYKMALITKPGGGATLIKQWGRIGSKGQVKVWHGDTSLMHRERDDVLNEKMAKKYRQIENENLTGVSDPNEIAARLIGFGFTSVGLSEMELSGPPDFSMESKAPKRAPEPEIPVVHPTGWGDW